MRKLSFIIVALTMMLATTKVSAMTYNEATLYVRKGLKNRDKVICVEVTMPIKSNDIEYNMKDMSNTLKGIYRDAKAHTGVENEGPSLSIRRTHMYSKCEEETYTYYTLVCVYMPEYFDTYEQEQQTDAACRKAVRRLKLKGLSTRKKIEKIYKFVAKHVRFDKKEERYKKIVHKSSYCSYGAIVKGKAVCQGYAELFYRLCLIAGIDCRVVYGNEAEPFIHAWNIVKVNGKWYYCDITWDDDGKKADTDYFLKGKTDFPYHTLSEDFDSSFLQEHKISRSGLKKKRAA